MSNWLPIATLASAILFSTIGSAIALQCSELEKPNWRVFNDLQQFKTNNKSFNVLVNADSNWVRIKRILTPNLNFNEFETVDAGYIVRLDISNLGIKSIINGTFKNLFCMEILELQDNALTTIPPGALSGMIHLKVLNVSKNYISHLTGDMFGYMKVLHTLDLSSNIIRSVEENAFVNFPRLQFLNLTYNLLGEIDFVQWSLTSSLTSVNMSMNNLVLVKINSNMTYPHFTKLDLSFNNLDYLNVPALKAMAPNMALLFVHGNKFHCADLERMVEDFARFHFFHRSVNQTFYNVDGIDCIGRFDEDLTLFDQKHKKQSSGPTKYFPASEIPQRSASSISTDEFLKTINNNYMKLLEAIHGMRTIIVFLFVFVLLFIFVNVLIKTGLTERFFTMLRSRRRAELHEPIDSSMEVENFRLIPSVQNVRV